VAIAAPYWDGVAALNTPTVLNGWLGFAGAACWTPRRSPNAATRSSAQLSRSFRRNSADPAAAYNLKESSAKRL
jgi:hypothetical protein